MSGSSKKRATASNWRDASLRQDLHDAKRRLILTQAARMFADDGFHQTTIEKIASALNVTKPTIYYYIESKEDILYKILQLALDELDTALAQNESIRTYAIDRLEKFFHVYGEIILSDFGFCMALVTDRSLNVDHRKKLRSLKKEFELRVRSIVADGLRDGSIHVSNPRLFSNALFGAYNWMPQWFSRSGSMTAEDAGREIFKLFRQAATSA
ncbi:TetR/AcrR family transcriptional regulator [Phreatobacter sp.]|uniref:TetR/AcrR family transcriptional regulator n=1 Tax=Phreatobacter sp. TaxID=1966341 RepID=UPI003F706C26